MDVRQLLYFTTIVEEGSISAAAKKLHLSQPPLSHQLKLLEEELNLQLVQRGPRCITLTDAGRAIAEKIYARHRLLSGFLMQLGVDEKTAAEDACKMEHVISDASMEAIKRHAAGRIK